MSTCAGKKHFLLLYTYVPDMMERRTPHREEHLNLIKSYKQRGLVIQGGAFVPPTGGAITFEADSQVKIIQSNIRNSYVFYVRRMLSTNLCPR